MDDRRPISALETWFLTGPGILLVIWLPKISPSELSPTWGSPFMLEPPSNCVRLCITGTSGDFFRSLYPPICSFSASQQQYYYISLLLVCSSAAIVFYNSIMSIPSTSYYPFDSEAPTAFRSSWTNKCKDRKWSLCSSSHGLMTSTSSHVCSLTSRVHCMAIQSATRTYF